MITEYESGNRSSISENIVFFFPSGCPLTIIRYDTYDLRQELTEDRAKWEILEV